MANKRFGKPAKDSVTRTAVAVGRALGHMVGSVEALATRTLDKASSTVKGARVRRSPASAAPRRAATGSGGRKQR